jgi:hypothetical protein
MRAAALRAAITPAGRGFLARSRGSAPEGSTPKHAGANVTKARTNDQGSIQQRIHIVVNWIEELQHRVPCAYQKIG